MRQVYDVEVKWVHFPLHPDTPPEGVSVEAMFEDRLPYIDAMRDRLQTLFAEEGLPVGDMGMVYRSRLAQELGAWADTQPGGAAIHDALFRAVFVDGRNIGKPDVLVDVVARVGLDPRAARRVLEEGTFSAAVDMDWARSLRLGVSGVPTFVADRQGVAGAQPYEILAVLVEEGGAARRVASAKPLFNAQGNASPGRAHDAMCLPEGTERPCTPTVGVAPALAALTPGDDDD